MALPIRALFARAFAPAFAWLFVVSGPSLRAAVSVDAGLLSSGYVQYFDSLPASGSVAWNDGVTLAGWHAVNSAGAISANVTALDGASNMVDLLIGSLGTSGASDRALAYHTRLNTAPTYIGLSLVNNSGRPLNSFTLSYVAEQWRESASARNLTFTVQYRVGAVLADLGATTGWTTLPTLAATTLNGSVGASAALTSGVVAVDVPVGTSLWFRWVTTNSATSSTSSNDILAVDGVQVAFGAAADPAAPVFTTQPQSLTIATGANVTFTAVASGTPAPTYQWRHGTADLSGETGASLMLTNVQLAQAGSYTVVATNASGFAVSDPAVLTVSDSVIAPQITTQPVGVVADLGANATFSVVASGTEPLSYQWFHGTESISGETGASLTLAAITDAAAGAYTVTVTNSAGSVTSDAATLTVRHPPSIVTPPASQTVSVGGSANFTVTVSGEAPFTYQWRKNGQPIVGSVGAGLSLSNIQVADAAAYSVVVTNVVGSATSADAVLTVAAPPQFTLQPRAQTALSGSNLTLAVAVAGSGPFAYQWYRDGTSLAGETGASLIRTTIPFSVAGAYHVTATNAFGTTVSATASVEVLAALPDSAFNLAGFGQATTGGGVIAESDAGYRKVATALEFATAIADKTGAVKVIEIMNDLDLGWNEVGAAVQAVGPFRQHAVPKLHPRLIATGVSLIDIQNKTGLTIFSANGATIRHATLNIKSCNNIIVRNLRFDEMWEWDEANKGDYDSNDWDFIDLGNSGTVYNVWIDHCTFTKAYDGISDIKKGSYNITFSWNKYEGDDGATNPNSFVRQQVAALEANRSSYAFYNFLRTNGFSVEDIVSILQGHDKTHLIGATSLTAENADHTLTFHHQWHINPWDRLPRLRAGNVHNYNLLVDDTLGRIAKRLRDTRANAMSTTLRNTLNNTYNFNIFLNGSISTEGGAVLVEKSVYLDCITPLRNNQTDPTDPTYTGKILGLDTICRMTTDAGVSTTVRGNSTDAGNPMGPFQAAVIPFSWNLPGNVLPYSYQPDDPAELASILARGAGAGRLVWSKANWLKVTYPATAPTIPLQAENRSVEAGQGTVFAPVVVGSAPLSYQWFKNDVAISGATGPTHTITAASAADAGDYTLVASNSVGSVTSSAARLTVTLPPVVFADWAARWYTGGSAAAGADPDGDNLPNLIEYALGLDPSRADSADAAVRLAVTGSGTWALRYPRGREATGCTFVPEISSDLVSWDSLPGVSVVESSTDTQDFLLLGFGSSSPRVFVRLRVTQP